jgi:hypothetical protein
MDGGNGGPDGANAFGPRRRRVLDACPGVLAKEVVKVDDRGAMTGLSGSPARRGDPVKCGARVALGVAGGYFLGRTKKMKLALALAGMAAGKRAGGPGQLLAQGTKLLGQSPEITRLTDELRGRLLDAGKGAAVAIATRQVEALTERVVHRVGDLTDAGGKAVGGVGETVGDVGKTVGGLGRRQSRDDVEYDDEYDETADESTFESVDETGEEDQAGTSAEVDESRDDQGEDEAAPAPADEDEAPPPRRRPARAGAAVKGATGAAGKQAGDATRLAGKATAGRGGRSARGRQGRSDG